MASEIRIQTSLQVKKGNLQYQSKPTAFVANMTGTKGPSPGVINVGPTHSNIDFSQLTTPASCRIMNLDSALTVDVGLYLSTYNIFVPMLEFPPGHNYVIRLSQFLGEDLVAGTGTGTADTNVARLAIKCRGGTAPVLIEAFDA